jgi:hypothetical protein
MFMGFGNSSFLGRTEAILPSQRKNQGSFFARDLSPTGFETS